MNSEKIVRTCKFIIARVNAWVKSIFATFKIQRLTPWGGFKWKKHRLEVSSYNTRTLECIIFKAYNFK